MGDRFENQQALAYTRIVKDWPLSPYAEESKARLQALNRPVPEADPVAYARMKYEQENRTERGLLGKMWGPFSSRPDMSQAAKSGSPQMTSFQPLIPATVPASAAGAGVQGTSDVSAALMADASALDRNPDARSAAAQASAAGIPPAEASAPAIPVVLTRSGVDLNSAAEADLAKLPGVGKDNAKRIIAGRPFLSVGDLIRVGISKKTIDRLKPDANGGGTSNSSSK
jgi:DNA uptake protein ComE-like DNA-binding protein